MNPIVHDFNYIINCKIVTKYHLPMSDYYNKLSLGREVEEPNMPSYIYDSLCEPNDHEYYDFNSSNRCTKCGYMKIIDDCGVILHDEIISRIICMNSVYNGLLISKQIKQECLRYAVPLIASIDVSVEEKKLISCVGNLVIRCWLSILQVDIVRIFDDYRFITETICFIYSEQRQGEIAISHNNKFIVGNGYNRTIPTYYSFINYSTAPILAKFMNRRLMALGAFYTFEPVPGLLDMTLKLKSKLTDFQYAVYLMCSVIGVIPNGEYVIEDVIKEYEPIVYRMFGMD